MVSFALAAREAPSEMAAKAGGALMASGVERMENDSRAVVAAEI